jgi:predicted short-subunit dehydrogenase-like oxidoreductase (DUF2520 family)
MENKIINALRFVLIGSGNIAYSLGQGLLNTGHHPIAVIARNTVSGNDLAAKLGCSFSTNLSDVPTCDIVFICLPDQHISAYYNQISYLQNTLICHSSGMTPLQNNLEKQRCGVFYPLQTLSKHTETNWKQTPILVEANNQNDTHLLLNLANDLSDFSVSCNSIDRSYYHLAAVFANNFTNYLVSQAQIICKNNGLDSTFLHPIITKTMEQAMQTENTFTLQTGPAIRNDHKTINQHLQLLNKNPLQKQLYEIITKSIQLNAEEK